MIIDSWYTKQQNGLAVTIWLAFHRLVVSIELYVTWNDKSGGGIETSLIQFFNFNLIQLKYLTSRIGLYIK